MSRKNFKRLLKINDLTQEKAAKMLNVNRQTINFGCKMEEFSDDVLQKVKLCFPDFDTQESHTMFKKDTKTEQDRAIKVPEYGLEGIPLIPIDAMAGFGKGEFQIMEYECERYVVPMFKGADFLIPVKGSSMIPKYNSGDVVACKRLLLNDIFFQWNKVYVLDTCQGALVKRIKKGSDTDHILIVSDNEQYEPFELHKTKYMA